jgi:hypothetical protein
MMVITSERHSVMVRWRLRGAAANNQVRQSGSKSKQKSSMSQKTGKMSMRELLSA